MQDSAILTSIAIDRALLYDIKRDPQWTSLLNLGSRLVVHLVHGDMLAICCVSTAQSATSVVVRQRTRTRPQAVTPRNKSLDLDDCWSIADYASEHSFSYMHYSPSHYRPD